MKTLPFLTLALGACLLTVSTASAQQVLKHAPRYEVGSTRRVEVNTQTNQTLTIVGMPVVTQAENFMVSRETVEAVAPDGTATLKSGFDSIQINLKIPGGIEYQFNSTNPEGSKAPIAELEGVTELFKALSVAEWTLTTDKEGKISSLKYTGDVLNRVPEALRGEASEETLKRQTNQEIARLPGKSVAVGESWERLERMDLGSGQIFEMTKKYTYLGIAEQGDRLLHKIQSELLSVTYDATQPLGPLEYKSSTLKPGMGDGVYWYSAEQGIIVEGSETLKIIGEMAFSLNGQELPATLDLTITVTSRTL